MKKIEEMLKLNNSNAKLNPNNENIINLTPHPVVLQYDDGTQISFPKSGVEARLQTAVEDIGSLVGFPIRKTTYLDVALFEKTDKGYIQIGTLPPEADGIFYIVSLPCLAKLQDRNDIACPDTGPTCIRDEKGQIIAVKGWIR